MGYIYKIYEDGLNLKVYEDSITYKIYDGYLVSSSSSSSSSSSTSSSSSFEYSTSTSSSSGFNDSSTSSYSTNSSSSTTSYYYSQSTSSESISESSITSEEKKKISALQYRFSGYQLPMIQLDETGPAYVVLQPHPYYAHQPDYWKKPFSYVGQRQAPMRIPIKDSNVKAKNSLYGFSAFKTQKQFKE